MLKSWFSRFRHKTFYNICQVDMKLLFYYYFLGISEIHDSLVKDSTVTFWAIFGKTWATFYFNIWSHCNRKAHSHEEDLHCIGVFCYDQNDAECFSDRMLCRAGVWHSWPRCRFRYHTTWVPIQPSTTFIEKLLTVCRKDKNKEKETRNGPL